MKFIQEKSTNYIATMLAFATLVMLLPFLGSVHLFDWDEINFAECAREMIVTGDYFRVTIDFAPFWEKPPLFIWLQVLSMKLFGINEFAARFPNVIIGVLSVVLLFVRGERLHSKEFGFWWSMSYVGSLLPHFYCSTGIIDPLFNLLIFLSVDRIIWSLQQHDNSLRLSASAWVGIFSGLAVLTKGPVAILLAGATWLISWIVVRKSTKQHFPVLEIFIALFVSTVVCSLWFGAEYLTHGPWFIEQFIQYQIRLLTTGDAGHSGPFYYHPVVLLLGCFPASMLLWKGINKAHTFSNSTATYSIVMAVLLAVVVIIFSVVKTKIVHYSSMAYYPITFLSAIAIMQVLKQKQTFPTLWKVLMTIQSVVISLLLILFPLALANKHLFIQNVKDSFTRQVLSTPVEWSGVEWIPGFAYLCTTVVALRYLWKGADSTRKGLLLLFSSTCILLHVFLPIVTPKIEQYTQATPIEWYQRFGSQNCYIKHIGFKSYASMFYSNKPYQLSAAAKNIPYDDFEGWLLQGTIDKPAYFVCKEPKKNELLNTYKLRVVEEKNGWVLLQRIP